METESPFRPSQRFVILHGDRVSRQQAERIVVGILYGHDTVPDLVTVTSELAMSMRRSLTFAEAAGIAATEGASFDREGWFVVEPPEEVSGQTAGSFDA